MSLLLAPNGHGAAVAACLLLGQQRTTFARREYFAFGDPQRTSSLGENFCKFQFSSVAGRSYGRPLIAAPFLTNMLKHLSANLDNTLIPNSQIARGPEREVENAVTNVWSAVCNANNH